MKTVITKEDREILEFVANELKCESISELINCLK
jgi:hypothetical protein